MSKSMKKKYVFIFVVLVAVALGAYLWATGTLPRGFESAPPVPGPSKFPPKSPPSSLFSSPSLSEFAKTVSLAPEPERGGGILPDPPRARLKQAERFIEDRLKSDVKITYDSSSSLYALSSSFTLVVYAAPEPFRWRVDFITNFKDKEYKDSYINDGNGYYTCKAEGNEPLKCHQQPTDYLEKYISTSPLLTNFLNDIFDSLTLKKLLMEVQKEERTIVGYSADCKVVEDEYGILDYCVAKDTNYLLYLDSKRKNASGEIVSQFTLKAQSVDLTPLPNEVFTSP